MHIRIREKISNGPVGGSLRDVTRRQFIKKSTGKLFFLPSGLTIKKQGEWLQQSVLGPPPALAHPTDEVSIAYGRGKYWLIYQKHGGQEKGRPFTTVGLKCCTAIPENANICAANTYRLALLIVIQSYLQNRGRGSVEI